MNFNHLGKRPQLIWDGKDDGITTIVYETLCPNCQNNIQYKLNDIADFNQLNNELKSYTLNLKIVSKNETGYEVKKGVPAYYIQKSCNTCLKELWILVGLKEIQPQRYNAYFKSTISSTKTCSS